MTIKYHYTNIGSKDEPKDTLKRHLTLLTSDKLSVMIVVGNKSTLITEYWAGRKGINPNL